MRLKRFFLGGLSLLMLGLFPTFAWASDEVRPVELSVAAVKQYYRDRDYVSLFDALVFAGGAYTKVVRPSEIYTSEKIWFTGQYDYLDPAISKVGKVYFRGDRQRGPIKEWPNPKTPQEVLEAGGSLVLSKSMGGVNFEREFLTQRKRVRSQFPLTKDYKILLSILFEELRVARNLATNFWDTGQLSKDGWYSCSHIKMNHTLDGAPYVLDDTPGQSAISVSMYGGRFPLGVQEKICFQQDFLFVVGLRGSTHSQLKKIHLISERRVGIGPVLKCALDLLYHPTISAGMDREKALSVLTALPKEDLHCE